MRCPNCHSVVGKNYGICQYCGYDIGAYVRQVQDRGVQSRGRRERQATCYAGEKQASQQEYNYENGYFYYKLAYQKEKEKNSRYRQTTLYGVGAILLLLHAAELIFLAAIYTM